MMYYLENIDIADALESGYIKRCLKKLNVIVYIVLEFGPGGGHPMCNVIGDQADVIKWLKNKSLGYGIKDDEIEEWDIQPFDCKYKKDLITAVMTI